MTYASGKFAVAICDRCGFKKKLHDLRKEWTGLKVCDACFYLGEIWQINGKTSRGHN